MAEGESKQTVTFNLGIDWNYKISNRIDAATSSYLNGDLKNWFFNLKAIKFLIVSYLKEKEREKLIEQETEITKCIDNRTKVAPLIESYDINIKDLLEDKGFLNPLRQDTTNVYGQGRD